MTWRPSERKRGDTQQQRPDLADVLDHYGVQYSPMRVRQMTSCPLHDDRTPSCSIDLGRQLFNCMSCGKAGSAWDLIMAKENVDFNGARAFAASQRFAEGGAGGGDGGLSGSAYGGRRKVPAKQGRRSGAGGYTPSWRRR